MPLCLMILSHVTPCVGVWIETPEYLTYYAVISSHPAWVCGLKPLKREDIMLLFKLVNEFQEKTSLIVTANYSLTEWLAIPGEEAVAAALLDRLLYCCEIIQLSRNSYRMENRKTIFSNRSEDTDTLKELTTVK